ncbi:hypothetical protein DFH06DRAFT_69349 [Mycena polygramma]|nr:hypothetical protein DFH06DRAFT_69349 [Mycena polygramma]
MQDHLARRAQRLLAETQSTKAVYVPHKFDHVGDAEAARHVANRVAAKEAREQSHKALFGADAQTRAAEAAAFAMAFAALVVPDSCRIRLLVPVLICLWPSTTPPAFPSASAPALPPTSAASTAPSTFGSISLPYSTPAAPATPAPAPAPALLPAPAPTDPFAKYTSPTHNPWGVSSAVQQQQRSVPVRADSETDERMGGCGGRMHRFQALGQEHQQRDVQHHQAQASTQQYPVFPPQPAQTPFASPPTFFPASSSSLHFASTQQKGFFAVSRIRASLYLLLLLHSHTGANAHLRLFLTPARVHLHSPVPSRLPLTGIPRTLHPLPPSRTSPSPRTPRVTPSMRGSGHLWGAR